MELIAPTYKLGLLRTETGKADLQTIINAFEWLLNIDLTHYAGLRCAIFKRQDLTPLLDRMRDAWIEASQKQTKPRNGKRRIIACIPFLFAVWQ